MQVKTKHIEIEHHYIKEITQARDLISTRQQLTNLVTKPLGLVDDAIQLWVVWIEEIDTPIKVAWGRLLVSRVVEMVGKMLVARKWWTQTILFYKMEKMQQNYHGTSTKGYFSYHCLNLQISKKKSMKLVCMMFTFSGNKIWN